MPSHISKERTKTVIMATLNHTNLKLNESCSVEEESRHMPFAILYSLIFLFGLAGNILALWVFIFLHSRRNSIRVFLINVALADLVLIACLPFRVLYHALGNWPLGSRLCKVVGNLFYMNMYVSIALLGLISLDRYVKIQGLSGTRISCCHRWMKGNKWSIMSCGVLWTASLLSVVPMIVLAENNEEHGKCFQYKSRIQARSKAYFNLFLVGVFWLVFLILVLSYGRIACRLLQESRDKPDLPNAGRYARSAKKSFVVLLLFTICFVPYHAFRGVYVQSQLTEFTCKTRHLVDTANEVMLLFSALNSCLDPLMYFVLSVSVRRATKKAVSQMLCWGYSPAATTNSSTTELRRTSMSQASNVAPATIHESIGFVNTSRSNIVKVKKNP